MGAHLPRIRTSEERRATELALSISAGAWDGPILDEEAEELRALEPCQVAALLHIRRQCAHVHKRALPQLQARARALGYGNVAVQQTLAYIREQAPVIIHVDIARHGALLADDTHYRNFFEVPGEASDEGAIHAQSRLDWEARLFGGAYAKARSFDRCKYGVLNVTNDPQGVRCCAPVYGSSYFLLRGVRLRTTLSAEDSAGLNASELATVDQYAHVLARYTDSELQAALEVGTGQRPGVDSLAVAAYKEAQVHGEVRLSNHVAVLMAHPSLQESPSLPILERLAERCCAPLVWMEVNAGVQEENDADSELRSVLEASREEEELRRAIEASTDDQTAAEDLRIALEASQADEATVAEASTSCLCCSCCG
mmetsp:Transcript_93526/g.185565  ORF Transcript_93526/g.185565 Transcript_93526/m.185565 type:complete len:369 (-) Transcript_93526:36-1142(-)